MVDDAFTAANKRRDQHLAEITRLKNLITEANGNLARAEQQVAELDAWIKTWHDLSGIPAQPTAAEHIKSVSSEKRTRPKNLDRSVIVKTALEIIAEEGKPVPRKQLHEAMQARGITIYGKDPEMVLSTMLWREPDKIVRLPPFGYWPKDRAYYPGGYDPAIDHLFGSAANEPEDGIEADDAED